MKRTVSLFLRDYEGNRQVRDEHVPGAEWVARGEGVATRKFDGTCCMVRAGVLFRRHDARQGKPVPAGFEPAQAADPVTGHWPGWLPVADGPQDACHREAMVPGLPDGTYELCGPKVQNNPENFPWHVLVRHGAEVLADCPRSFDALREYLRWHDMEGVVWHHEDGRMVKIKGRDFGLKHRGPSR